MSARIDKPGKESPETEGTFNTATTIRAEYVAWKRCQQPMRIRGFVHRCLNRAVLRWGDVPVLGRVLWWVSGQWQRFM